MLWLCFAVISFCQWMVAQSAATDMTTAAGHDHHAMMAVTTNENTAMPCCESQQPPCCGPTNVIPSPDNPSWFNLFTAVISIVAFLLAAISAYSRHYRVFSPLVPPPPRLILCRFLI